MLVTPAAVNLALWPPGARVVAESGLVTVVGAGAAARLGERSHVGGGQFSLEQRSFVEELIGEPVHSACDVDGYWLVSEVLAE